MCGKDAHDRKSALLTRHARDRPHPSSARAGSPVIPLLLVSQEWSRTRRKPQIRAERINTTPAVVAWDYTD